ncbi:hypothetical protein [Nocardia sp. NPDC059239]|uniref:hypothetical protein n=1 Tax=unclassified Nocardia TaxID=2637762 RepID=UPI003696B6D7
MSSLGPQQHSPRPPSGNYSPPGGVVPPPIGTEVLPEPWASGPQYVVGGGSAQAPGEADRTMPATLPPAEAAAAAPPSAAPDRKPLRRKDILISAVLYLAGVVMAFGWAYDLFAKLFDLIHNRCTAKKDFSVQCVVIRPPASALWGLLIGGGGMFLALVGALVLASVAAMTGRRGWIWTAMALPVILVAGGAGHILVATAVN